MILTGSHGFIGSRFLELFPCETISYTKSIPYIQNDTLIHLGWQASTGLIYTQYLDSLIFTINLLKQVSNCKFTFVSSVKVFNQHEELSPDNPYGQVKLLTENMLIDAENNKIINLQIIRLANIVGPKLKYGFLYEILQEIKSGEVEYRPDGKRPFVDLGDCVNILSKHQSGTYNLSNNSITTHKILQIAEKFAKFKIKKVNKKPICIEVKPDFQNIKSSEEVVENYFRENL